MTRARDALAAERRRMPWVPVQKTYAFDGPDGKMRLLDLFGGRRQLIVYHAFLEPGVFGWPEHACRGCSMASASTNGTPPTSFSATASVCSARTSPTTAVTRRWGARGVTST
jgi:predicted dithiol-disulfide oxidoreductase (DUF899 family)